MTKAFTIRSFDMNDLDECVALERQMVDHHREIYNEDSIPYDDERIASKLERTDENHFKFVAEENDRIVGLLLLEVKEEEGFGKILEIDDILVAKDRRQRGVGTAFFNLARREALEKGCTVLQVSFAARNIQALKFYHKMGINCLGMIQLFAPLSDKGKEKWYKKGKSTRFLGLKHYY